MQSGFFLLLQLHSVIFISTESNSAELERATGTHGSKPIWQNTAGREGYCHRRAAAPFGIRDRSSFFTTRVSTMRRRDIQKDIGSPTKCWTGCLRAEP